MRAVICRAWGEVESLKLEEVAAPIPGPDDVLISVKATAVNYADALMTAGRYQTKPDLPFSPGLETAGIVAACGARVTRLKPGDRVMAILAYGGLAEMAVAPAAETFAIPAGMSFEEAGAFPVAYISSHVAIRWQGRLEPGETLLVLGAAGGVGLTAVEIGKALGARVIAAASSEEKLAVCREHGADATINYSAEDLREAIKAATAGKGPDVIYDPVGGAYSEAAFRAIGWRGRHLVVGFANGEIPKLPLNLTLLKGASLVGVFWGEFARREPKANLAAMRQLLGWLGEGKIRPLISKRYALAETHQALNDMAARKVTGKVVIVPGDKA